MRLLITTDTVGGVWNYSLTLATALTIHHDAEVLLAAFGPAPGDAQQAQVARLPRVELCAYPSLLEWQPSSAAAVAAAGEWLLDLAYSRGADLLHANQFAFGALPTACPRIVAAHSDLLSWHEWCQPLDGPGEIDPVWREFVALYAGLVRRGLAGADAVVAPSRFIAASLRRLLYDYPRPVSVIHNGIAAHHPAAPVPRSGGPLRVFSAGRFWDQGKNVALLVEAAGGGIPGVEVELAGAGFQELSGAVTWLGELSHEILLARLPGYGVYVGTSRYEPFGLAPLEAAQAGCALVLNDIPAFRELWDGAALFVERNSAAHLRAVLQQIAADPVLLSSYSSSARERAGRYTAARMAQEYLRLYSRVLAAHSPAA